MPDDIILGISNEQWNEEFYEELIADLQPDESMTAYFEGQRDYWKRQKEEKQQISIFDKL